MFENAPISQSQSDEYSYHERKPVWKIIVITLIILVLASVAVYYVVTKHPHLFSKKNDSFSSDTTSVAASKPVPAKIEENTSPAVYSASPVNTNVNNKYHIIAGAFVVEKNATAFMAELQKKGYEPQIVLRRNEYSFISIFSFPTFKEANNKIKTFEGTGMPVWIMKYKSTM